MKEHNRKGRKKKNLEKHRSKLQVSLISGVTLVLNLFWICQQQPSWSWNTCWLHVMTSSCSRKSGKRRLRHLPPRGRTRGHNRWWWWPRCGWWVTTVYHAVSPPRKCCPPPSWEFVFSQVWQQRPLATKELPIGISPPSGIWNGYICSRRPWVL